ncbi:hypothetical protein AVMA1855_08585 [Acidovorax sp. SUPP1855]|uniref:hypothetical protein n=1 Tax=Acidovorax sp. SUPP1855 TaxID=431774 RepID=UPI0023DE5E61|nr:hypothetical protein [Acidovorax sp. SUPP1855]GKS84191.1 hypothetical protein AVMA1855_08585 [Acidovorax sp. SUPP1855]
MKRKTIKSFAATLLLSVFSNCHADDFAVLPVVTVTDEYNVDYNGWGDYNPWYFPTAYLNAAALDYLGSYAGTHAEAAILAELSFLDKSISVCIAVVSANAKSTTSASDVTSRWLAAQEVFNYQNTTGLLAKREEMIKNLIFIIDGKRYKGFHVLYADGVRETWAVNPGYSWSSVKLLDQPLPNSQEPDNGFRPKCNIG